MEIGDRGRWVRDARDRAQWTQEKFGEQVGCTKANVSHLENGNHEPSFTQLQRIEELTGHPLGLLMWPLPMVDAERFYALREQDQAYVQAKMLAAIEEREAADRRKVDLPPPGGVERRRFHAVRFDVDAKTKGPTKGRRTGG
jgi:transcriptional regulator with XRE-family HTH domain